MSLEIHDLYLSMVLLVLSAFYWEPAYIVNTAVQGWRKSGPESALRGFDILELTRWRVESCGLASTNQNEIDRWLPPIEAFKMGFSCTAYCLTSEEEAIQQGQEGQCQERI